MSPPSQPAGDAVFTHSAGDEHVVNAFISHGYVILRQAFEPQRAHAVMTETLQAQIEARCAETGLTPPERLDDFAFWGREAPVLKPMLGIPIAELSPWAARIIDALIGGRELARPIELGARWVINSKVYPRAGANESIAQLNWHVDSPEPGHGRAHLGRSTDALLLMAYWSDVPDDAGGTLFAPAALADQFDVICQSPDGVNPYEPDWGGKIFRDGGHPYFAFTGSAGDLLIAHALTLHSAQPKLAAQPIRVLENAVVKLSDTLDFRPENPAPTPVEQATINRLRASNTLTRHLKWNSAPTTTVKPPSDQAPLRLRVPPTIEKPLRRALGELEILLGERGVMLRVLRAGRATLTLELRDGGARGEWTVRPHEGGRVPPAKAAAAAAMVTKILRHLETAAPREMEVLRTWHKSARHDVVHGSQTEPHSNLDFAALGQFIPFLERATGDNRPMIQAIVHGLRGDRTRALDAAFAYLSASAVDGADDSGAAPAGPSEAALRLVRALHLAASGPKEVCDATLDLARQTGGREGARLLFSAGERAARDGDNATAWTLLTEALHSADDPESVGRAGRLASAVGAYEEGAQLARRALKQDPNAELALCVLLEDALARGLSTDALALAQQLEQHHPNNPAGPLGIGAALIGLGRRAEAIAPLTHAAELAPRDATPRLWLALLAYDHGDLATARMHQSAVNSHANRAQALVRVLVTVGDPPDRAERLRDMATRDTMYAGLFSDAIPAWTSPEAVDAALESEESLDAFTRGLLDRMRGNLSEPLTFFDPETNSRLPLTREIPARARASALLKTLRYTAPEHVREGLEALAEEFAISPHPDCYRGELLLWEGRYDDALAAFERGRKRFPARWAFVGSAAAHYLRGDKADAERELAACDALYRPLDSATTSVYVGEFERRAGNFEAARSHLSRALRTKPSRHAARMNLALMDAEEGNLDALQEHWTQFWQVLPGLMHDAATAIGIERTDRWALDSAPAVMESALTLMQGNRASTLVTYIADDKFRVAPDPTDWVRVARAAARYAQERSGKPPS